MGKTHFASFFGSNYIPLRWWNRTCCRFLQPGFPIHKISSRCESGAGSWALHKICHLRLGCLLHCDGCTCSHDKKAVYYRISYCEQRVYRPFRITLDIHCLHYHPEGERSYSRQVTHVCVINDDACKESWADECILFRIFSKLLIVFFLLFLIFRPRCIEFKQHLRQLPVFALQCCALRLHIELHLRLGFCSLSLLRIRSLLAFLLDKTLPSPSQFWLSPSESHPPFFPFKRSKSLRCTCSLSFSKN